MSGSTRLRVLLAVAAIAATLIGSGLALVNADQEPSRSTNPTAYVAGEVDPIDSALAARMAADQAVPVSAKAVATIGLATFNQQRTVPAAATRRDVIRLASRPDIDLIGWQETQDRKAVRALRAIRGRGWTTVYWTNGGREGAISYRTAKFTLVGKASLKMHDGAGKPATRWPFPSRWTTRVTLRHRASGHLLTLLNTHVNHRMEKYPDDIRRARYTPGFLQPGLNLDRGRLHIAKLRAMLTQTTGRWTFLTGDLNFDWRGDRRRRPAGLYARTLTPVAVNSFQSQGLPGAATQRDDPRTSRVEPARYIDYVWAKRSDVGSGRTHFDSQRVLSGYASDHRPVLVRFSLH